MAISVMSLNFYNDYVSPWSPAMTADIPAGSLRALLISYMSSGGDNCSAITWDSKSPDITKTVSTYGRFHFYLWLIGTGEAITAKNIALTVGNSVVKNVGLWRLSGVRQNTTALSDIITASVSIPNGDAFWRDYGGSPGVLAGGLGIMLINRNACGDASRVAAAASSNYVLETLDTELMSGSYRIGAEPVEIAVHDTTGTSGKTFWHAEIAVHPGKRTLGIMTYCKEWVKKYNDLMKQGAVDLSKQPIGLQI